MKERERERNTERDRDREEEIGKKPSQTFIDRHTFNIHKKVPL